MTGEGIDEMVKKVFRVPNMRCSGCAMALEGLEDELDGVKAVNASYHKQTMEVEYDERRVTEVRIIAAAKQLGYDALPA